MEQDSSTFADYTTGYHKRREHQDVGGSSDSTPTSVINFDWPHVPGLDLDEDVLVGCYSPRPIAINYHPSPLFETFQAPGILLAARRAGVRANHAPLHLSDDYALVFRGYIVEPALHAHSPTHRLLEELGHHWDRGRNGVYTCAVYDRREHRVGLLTDTLGFGPLYFRTIDDVWLFSTNPRYLSIAGDQPDRLGWLSLLHCGSFVGERTLTRDIKRLSAGSTLTLAPKGARVHRLASFDDLPVGDRSAGPDAVQLVEQGFQEAMERVLGLGDMARFLPLSSGHDSRRVLATLVDRGEPFTAHTVRVHQKEFRDLDASYAAEMARHFGFQHEVLEPRRPLEYASDDRKRRVLMDGESFLHSWAVPLLGRLPERAALLFDGVVGDILGNPGFRMPGMYSDNRRDRDLIVATLTSSAFSQWLNTDFWPSVGEYQEEMGSFIDQFLSRANMAEFVFILLRQRRMISPWSQLMIPTGHVVACPYLDLEYLRLLLSFRPADKHRIVFQRRCLEQFWPDYARFPGNRDIPKDLPPGNPRVDEQRELACYHQMRRELANERSLFNNLLSHAGRARCLTSRVVPSVWRSSSWLNIPLLELATREARCDPAWEVRPCSR